MDRRAFLERIIGGALLSGTAVQAFADRRIQSIGVQLSTFQEMAPKDLDGVLARVALIGYREAELAGFAQASDGAVSFWARTPQQMRAALVRAGLVSPAAHVDFESLAKERFLRVVEAASTIDNRYVVVHGIENEADRIGKDAWKRAAETFNRAGEACRKAGLEFAYHNHWFEFLPVEGKLPYDILLDRCDARLVKMELDICTVSAVGRDPVEYLSSNPGRFPLVQVKDLRRLPTRGAAFNPSEAKADITEVGSGAIDWKRILSYSEVAGIRHYIVEHDSPAKPFDSIAASYAYLQGLRF